VVTKDQLHLQGKKVLKDQLRRQVLKDLKDIKVVLVPRDLKDIKVVSVLKGLQVHHHKDQVVQQELLHKGQEVQQGIHQEDLKVIEDLVGQQDR
jgi:hypothetical protein